MAVTPVEHAVNEDCDRQRATSETPGADRQAATIGRDGGSWAMRPGGRQARTHATRSSRGQLAAARLEHTHAATRFQFVPVDNLRIAFDRADGQGTKPEVVDQIQIFARGSGDSSIQFTLRHGRPF
jgi:hypothetical protein